MDGTLIEAWASQKSFQPKDGGPAEGENFHGQKRSNQTHQSKTDPDAKLYEYCAECAQLIELGMRDAVKQFGYQKDTQQKQSYTAHDQSGYQDKIPTRKFSASRKERV